MLVSLGLFGLNGVVLLQPDLISGLLGHNAAAHVSRHFRSLDHRIHDLTFALIFGTAVVGMLAQLRKPSENIAAQVMALIPWVGLALLFPLTTYWVYPGARFVLVAIAIYGGLTLLAALLHPSRHEFLRSFSASRVNWALLTLVIIAAVPLLLFASANIGLQTGAISEHGGTAAVSGAAAAHDDGGAGTHDEAMHQEHIDAGHFGFMAAFSFIVIGVGLLASLRPDGWRLTAWVAGFLPALLGLASVVYPDNSSSFGLAWGLAAIVWGAMFVATGEIWEEV